MTLPPPVAAAVVAHPDDVEFMMAGTLLLLKAAGAEIHLWNLANGGLGSARHSPAEIAEIRWRETLASARVAGATAHRPLFDDLAIFYDAGSLARVSAGLRSIKPSIILTHPLVDYMEDHQNTARLVVAAAFSRATKYQVTEPAQPPYEGPVAIYHALPHGLHGPLGELPMPSHFVNIAQVLPRKREMLLQHESQQEWLDASQGLGGLTDEMERMGREVGRMSGRFAVAEGFSKHWHLGFAPPAWDPLCALLGGDVQRRESQ